MFLAFTVMLCVLCLVNIIDEFADLSKGKLSEFLDRKHSEQVLPNLFIRINHLVFRHVRQSVDPRCQSHERTFF
jgi:hypothetical protein